MTHAPRAPRAQSSGRRAPSSPGTFTGLAVAPPRRRCSECGHRFRVSGDAGQDAFAPGGCPECGNDHCPVWTPAEATAPGKRAAFGGRLGGAAGLVALVAAVAVACAFL